MCFVTSWQIFLFLQSIPSVLRVYKNLIDKVLLGGVAAINGEGCAGDIS